MEPEFAPGIPESKPKGEIPTVKNEYWKVTVHDHSAVKAKRHFDLRLSDGNKAYSWAIKKGLPEPEGKVKAIRQFDHTPEYMGFEGTIGFGYGKGIVKIDHSGMTKITESGPGKISFVLLNKKIPEEYTMVNTKGGTEWLLINHTPTTKLMEHIPLWKEKYKSITDADKMIEDDKYAMQPKIDGAHTLLNIDKNKIKLFSYRPSSTSDKLIQHTYKFPELGKTISEELNGTTMRTELFAVDKEQVPIPNNVLSGILNSNTENALKYIRENDIKFMDMPFDITRYKGTDVSQEPYMNKLNMIENIVSRIGIENIFSPPTAMNERDKKNLLQKIKQKKYPFTGEGVIFRDMNDGKPYKYKIRPEYDVWIKNVYPEEKHPELAGGFSYSLSKDGNVVGNVGTGFTDKMRADAIANPENYIGKSIRVEAQEQFPSGALRAPSFVNWDIEKNIDL